MGSDKESSEQDRRPSPGTDLGFHLTTVVILAGLWVYLLQEILATTAEATFDGILALLGFIHYAVLIYLGLAVYVLYRRGLSLVTNDPKRHDGESTAILFGTWPLFLVSLPFAYGLAKLVDGFFALFFLVYAITALGFVVWLKFMSGRHGSVGEWYNGYKPALGIGALGMLATWWIYAMLMSLVFANVEVETDKEFYGASDPVLAYVSPGGYLFKPKIKSVTLGRFERDSEAFHDGGATFRIEPVEHLGETHLSVAYKPQLYPDPKTHRHRVRFAK